MQGLQLRSLVKETGDLELSLVRVDVPEPGDDEVMIRVEATPINPSDIGLLTALADMRAAKMSGTKDTSLPRFRKMRCARSPRAWDNRYRSATKALAQ